MSDTGFESVGHAIERVGPAQVVQAAAMTREQIELIKSTVAKGATDLELKLFLYQCQRTGLDPLSKQIHFIKRFNRKANREEGTIQTGIDGYRTIADRTGDYAGNDDALFTFGADTKFPETATVTVYKIVRGVRCAFSATARWSEYYPGDGDQGFFWRKMPRGQLAKCAESLALRKAFPQQLSGVYTDVEMQQAQSDGSPVVDAPTPLPDPQPATTSSLGQFAPPTSDGDFMRTGYVSDVSPKVSKKNKPYTFFRLCQTPADAAQKNGFSVSCFDAGMAGALKSLDGTDHQIEAHMKAKTVGKQVYYNLEDLRVLEAPKKEEITEKDIPF